MAAAIQAVFGPRLWWIVAARFLLAFLLLTAAAPFFLRKENAWRRPG